MDEPNLVLDEIEERFSAFQLVRKTDPEAKASALSELGASSEVDGDIILELSSTCLLYTSPSPRDQRGSRMPSSA